MSIEKKLRYFFFEYIAFSAFSTPLTFCFSERLFPFSKDQVRVVLFRECDFRGRKLLFDSQAVRKVALAKTNVDIQQQTREPPKETYAETSNGHGYTVSSLSMMEEYVMQYFIVCQTQRGFQTVG